MGMYVIRQPSGTSKISLHHFPARGKMLRSTIPGDDSENRLCAQLEHLFPFNMCYTTLRSHQEF